MEGATQTQHNFTGRCPVIAQARSAVEAGCDDHEAALNTQLEFVAHLPGTIGGMTVAAGAAVGDSKIAMAGAAVEGVQGRL